MASTPVTQITDALTSVGAIQTTLIGLGVTLLVWRLIKRYTKG